MEELVLAEPYLVHDSSYPVVDVGEASLSLTDGQTTEGQGWACHGVSLQVVYLLSVPEESNAIKVSMLET